MTMFGLCSRHISRCLSYSSSVALCTAYTLIPLSARAAATSSCVESTLLPVAERSAPPAASTWHKYAVLASICMERDIFTPSKGFVFRKSSSMDARRGMLCFTHSIFRCPEGASFIFFTSYFFISSFLFREFRPRPDCDYSTVTDFARFFGLSMSQPLSFATKYANI